MCNAGESKHNILSLISILCCDNYRSREKGSHHSTSCIEHDEMYYCMNLWSVFSLQWGSNLYLLIQE